jgi:NADH-quinone oxidoreductase subunit N
MTAEDVTAGLALIALGLGAVVAMLLAPRSAPHVPRLAATVALAVALAAATARVGEPVVVTPLLRDDGLARLGQILVCLSGLGALAFLRPPLPAREGPALVLLCTLGAAVLCAATHAATLFLGLELVTLSLIAIFVLPASARALEAGYKLLILGGIGAATLLLALALAYADTGSLALSAWTGNGATMRLAAALLLAGLAFKFALVPFHMWTPDAFAGAHPAAAALAGTGPKIGAAVVLLRLDALGPPEPVWSLGLAGLAAASVLLGSLQALRQVSLGRMIGYSSIVHSGYLAALLASGSTAAPEAILFYLAAYAPALILALCAASLVAEDCRIDDLRGLAWRQPLAGGAFALALVSMAGLPVSVGFFGKLFLFGGLIRAEAWILLAVTLVGAALGLYVYARFLTAAFRTGPETPPTPAALPERLVLLAGSAAVAGLGLHPGPLIDAIRAALG